MSVQEVYISSLPELKLKTTTNMTLDYEWIEEQEDVRKHIQACEGKHTQQAMYSTFHDALTQICFGCKTVRSTIKR